MKNMSHVGRVLLFLAIIVEMSGCVSPLESSDPNVRQAALAGLTNDVDLVRFAKADPERSVRLAAVRLIGNERSLCDLIDAGAAPLDARVQAAEQLRTQQYIDKFSLSRDTDYQVRLVLIPKVSSPETLLRIVSEQLNETELKDAASQGLAGRQEYINKAVRAYQSEYLLRATTDIPWLEEYILRSQTEDMELIKKIRTTDVLRKVIKAHPALAKEIIETTDDQGVIYDALVASCKEYGSDAEKETVRLLKKVTDETMLLKLIDSSPRSEHLNLIAKHAKSDDVKIKAYLQDQMGSVWYTILKSGMSDDGWIKLASKIDTKVHKGSSWEYEKTDRVAEMARRVDKSRLYDLLVTQFEVKKGENGRTYVSLDGKLSAIAQKAGEDVDQRLKEYAEKIVRSEDEAVMKSLAAKAEKGDLSAILEVAKFAADRNQLDEAFKWRMKAVEQNHADSMWRVGNYYLNGWAVQKDVDKATMYYRRAADMGHGEAVLSLTELLFVKENPNIQFVFFAPPYSVLYWYTLQTEGKLDATLSSMSHVYKALLQYPNVRLFYFQNDFDTISNLANYKDDTHYRTEINQKMLHCFSTDEYQLNSENCDSVLAEMKQYVLQFDYDKVFERK